MGLGIVLILISLPLMIVPIVGIPLFIIGIIVILSSIGKKNSEHTAKATAREMARVEDARSHEMQMEREGVSNQENQKWLALVKYDDDIRAAVQRLEPLGDDAVDKFQQIFLALNDKSKIPDIVNDLTVEFADQT